MPVYTYEDLKKLKPECFKYINNTYGPNNDICLDSSVVYIYDPTDSHRTIDSLDPKMKEVGKYNKF